jgi:hypothetical protein
VKNISLAMIWTVHRAISDPLAPRVVSLAPDIVSDDLAPFLPQLNERSLVVAIPRIATFAPASTTIAEAFPVTAIVAPVATTCRGSGVGTSTNSDVPYVPGNRRTKGVTVALAAVTTACCIVHGCDSEHVPDAALADA